MSVCILNVSNTLLMSSAVVVVCHDQVSRQVSQGSCRHVWLKPVAMVMFMLCSAVLVEWLLLKPCCVEICGMLFVMYGRSVFSSVLLSLREVRWVCMMCLC